MAPNVKKKPLQHDEYYWKTWPLSFTQKDQFYKQKFTLSGVWLNFESHTFSECCRPGKKRSVQKKTAKQKSNNVKMYDEKRVVKKIMQSKTRTKRLFRLSMLNKAFKKMREHEPS